MDADTDFHLKTSRAQERQRKEGTNKPGRAGKNAKLPVCDGKHSRLEPATASIAIDTMKFITMKAPAEATVSKNNLEKPVNEESLKTSAIYST